MMQYTAGWLTKWPTNDRSMLICTLQLRANEGGQGFTWEYKLDSMHLQLQLLYLALFRVRNVDVDFKFSEQTKMHNWNNTLFIVAYGNNNEK